MPKTNIPKGVEISPHTYLSEDFDSTSETECKVNSPDSFADLSGDEIGIIVFCVDEFRSQDPDDYEIMTFDEKDGDTLKGLTNVYGDSRVWSQGTFVAAYGTHHTLEQIKANVSDLWDEINTVESTLNDHSSRHEDGGQDEINLEDLDGESTEIKNHKGEEDKHRKIKVYDAVEDIDISTGEVAIVRGEGLPLKVMDGSFTVEVGPEEDIYTIQGAMQYLSQYSPRVIGSYGDLTKATILLKDGFEMDEEVHIMGGNWGWITIESEADTVTMVRTAATTEFDWLWESPRAMFYGENCVMPNIAVNFEMDTSGAQYTRCGMVLRNATISFLEGSGLNNCAMHGLSALGACIVSAKGASFNNNNDWGVYLWGACQAYFYQDSDEDEPKMEMKGNKRNLLCEAGSLASLRWVDASEGGERGVHFSAGAFGSITGGNFQMNPGSDTDTDITCSGGSWVATTHGFQGGLYIEKTSDSEEVFDDMRWHHTRGIIINADD